MADTTLTIYFAQMSYDGGKTWNPITSFPGGKSVSYTIDDVEDAIALNKSRPWPFGVPKFRIVRHDLVCTVEKEF